MWPSITSTSYCGNSGEAGQLRLLVSITEQRATPEDTLDANSGMHMDVNLHTHVSHM